MVHAQLNRKHRPLILAALIVLILTGCSTGPSHFDRSWSASAYFEKYQVLSDHNYYYFGHPHGPDAVVGIRNGWNFETTSWNTMEADERKIRDLVERMQNTPGSEYNQLPNGAYIYNAQREVIGVWYSVWRLPVLTFTDEKSFRISDPVTEFPTTNTDPERRRDFFLR